MLARICLAAALATVSTVALAQNDSDRTRDRESRACRGDAHRLCRKEGDDELAVANCLQTNKARISRACRAVLEGHGM
jgi:hypothetical protein